MLRICELYDERTGVMLAELDDEQLMKTLVRAIDSGTREHLRVIVVETRFVDRFDGKDLEAWISGPEIHSS